MLAHMHNSRAGGVAGLLAHGYPARIFLPVETLTTAYLRYEPCLDVQPRGLLHGISATLSARIRGRKPILLRGGLQGSWNPDCTLDVEGWLAAVRGKPKESSFVFSRLTTPSRHQWTRC